jgi:hypothetical protein
MSDEINEHDVVVLLRDMPDANLVAGETGTVVHVYPGDPAPAFEVEFRAARGSSVGGSAGVVTIDASHLLKPKSNRFRKLIQSLS